MYFTREPIIETIITPKEGYKLVLRNSKTASQEEYCVDAVEVVCFGSTYFFRSLEKPKAFLIPVADYEVLETREVRMVLKTPGIEKGIKIAGGKESSAPMVKTGEEKETEETLSRLEKRRERRKGRKRKTRDDVEQEVKKEAQHEEGYLEEKIQSGREKPAGLLIPPPTTLISETLSRYKETPVFAGAFYKEKEDLEEEVEEVVETSEEREEPLIHEQANHNGSESEEDF